MYSKPWVSRLKIKLKTYFITLIMADKRLIGVRKEYKNLIRQNSEQNPGKINKIDISLLTLLIYHHVRTDIGF